MANLHRGELTIDADGRQYTLAVSSNALAALEGLFSTSEKRVTWQEVCGHAARNSHTHIRGILWAMLRKHHREMTLEDAGDLIDAIGLDALDAKLTEIIVQTVPDPVDLKKLGITPGNPRRAQAGRRKAGTGTRSSARAAASV